MKHVGILAHSVEGAALCFKAFCHEGMRVLGPHQHPDVTLDCVAMGHSMDAWESRDHDAIRKILAASAATLARAGADFFACPDNTVHLALELPGPDLALPGLHIADVVAAQAAKTGYRRVGVLGTKWTMGSDLYPRALAEHGLQAVIPTSNERSAVDAIIFDELVNGVFTDTSRARYVEIIAALKDRGCDAVALVCTEIPLLISPEVSPLPTLDSTVLLAHAALEVVTGRRPMPTWRGGPLTW